MKLFTVGPVEMYPETLKIEGTQQPYFRTPEFSIIMKQIEVNFLKSIFAPSDSHFVGLTCSGTGAMEAAVVNTLTPLDKVLIIKGGSFGARFAQICEVYQIPYESYDLQPGQAFNKVDFENFNNRGFTALLVNASETSTSQKYDIDYLGDFCKRNGMYFIVDAVSAYLADPLRMKSQHIDVLLTASQKALALAPGVALVALSDRIYRERVVRKKATFYFDFLEYVENQKRGQPPFTSSVGTMLALHQRLKDITQHGVEAEWKTHADRAEYFRSKIIELPVTLPTFSMSNSCTAIHFNNADAVEVYENMKSKYEIILTPSGGELKHTQLRVGHLGNLCRADYDNLIEKLRKELK